jgi:O-antigen ligase
VTSPPAIGEWIGLGQDGRIVITRRALLSAAAVAVGVLAIIVVSRISVALFVALSALLLVGFAALSYRAPRPVLVALVFAPIFDRYLISLFVPSSLHRFTNFLSEGLLLVVALVILVRGLRDDRLLPSLRHWSFALLLAFLAVAGVSAVINGVPPLIALAGIAFTLDAVVLFFLPRIVGFDMRHAQMAVAAFLIVAVAGAVLALCQVVLAPDFLGMEVSKGRFGEGNRVGAFFNGNPNMLGAILALALPATAFPAFQMHGLRRWIALALTFLIALALLFTFSRGAWLGLAIALVVASPLVDRRVLGATFLIALLAYGTAHVMPRGLLLDAGDTQGEEVIDLGEATLGRLDAIGEGRDLRAQFVENAAPIIGDHPLTGAGPGRYGGAVAAIFNSPLHDQYRAGTVPEGRTVDNFWLHLLVEFGLLGLLAFVGILVVPVRESLLAARRSTGMARAMLAAFACGGIILAVDSITEMLMEGNTTSFTMWFFLGVGSALSAAIAARAATAGASESRLATD